jgi:hypothetical protein
MQSIIPLIATKLDFTRHCLIYTVKPKEPIPERFIERVFPFYCDNSISEKDLIYKGSLLCFKESISFVYNDVVYFKTHNVTPQFYESLVNKIEPDFYEYESELSAIYLVGDIVGYVMV